MRGRPSKLSRRPIFLFGSGVEGGSKVEARRNDMSLVKKASSTAGTRLERYD
jgi:hypothetical protein